MIVYDLICALQHRFELEHARGLAHFLVDVGLGMAGHPQR